MSKKSLEDSYKMCFWSMVLIIILLVLMMLTGCTTTKYVTVPEYHTDTLMVTKQQRDSIWLHDSIRVTEKGDTVRIEKWHTKYVEKQVHDTTYISKTDSVPQPYPVTQYVEKPLSTPQKGLMVLGSVLLFLGIYRFARWLKDVLP